MAKRKSTTCSIAAALLLWAMLLLVCGVRPLPAQATSDVNSARAQHLAKMKKCDPNTVSLAMLPVQIWFKHPMVTSHKVADALGLVVESYGMNNLDALDAEFIPPADAAWEQVPVHLAEFLKKNPPKNEYVLYAQYLGDPNGGPTGGPTEIRFVVTDAAGNLVLSDRQTRQDEDFKRIVSCDPDPMGCSSLVAERLFSLLGWQKVKGEPHGKFARKWAQASGTPSDEEQAAMGQRAAKLKANIKTAQIAIYSTCIGEERNTESAAHLASLLAQQFGCKTIKVDKPVSFQRQPTGNEQKLLWDLARAFRDYLRANPADSNYAMLAEYFVNPAGGPVGAVHFVVCEKSGDWVLIDFQNNTHKDFQRIMPKSIEDCDRLAIERLAKRLKIVLTTAATASASELTVVSYETSETNLTLSSPDTGMTLTKVLGGTGGAPAATQGSYVLKAVWSNQPDRKVEIRHGGLSYNLASFDKALVDVFIPTGAALFLSTGLIGIWSDNWMPGKWSQGDIVPTENNRWFTIEMNIDSFSPGLLDHISALVFENYGADSGTLYVDNIRLIGSEPNEPNGLIATGWPSNALRNGSSKLKICRMLEKKYH